MIFFSNIKENIQRGKKKYSRTCEKINALWKSLKNNVLRFGVATMRYKVGDGKPSRQYDPLGDFSYPSPFIFK